MYDTSNHTHVSMNIYCKNMRINYVFVDIQESLDAKHILLKYPSDIPVPKIFHTACLVGGTNLLLLAFGKYMLIPG